MSGQNTVSVFVDFDDTLTTSNVAQFLLKRFAPEALEPTRALYRDDKITFREYQERAFDAVNATVEEMQAAVANTIELRDGALELVGAVREAGGKFTVLSAGLRFYIDPVLRSHGIQDVTVVCGTATRDESQSGPAGQPFRYDYPFTVEPAQTVDGCRGDWATCKCRAVEAAGVDVITVFAGDGSTSDACVATRVDHLFARDRLLDICARNGVEVTPFEDLRTVADFVRSITSKDPPVKARLAQR